MSFDVLIIGSGGAGVAAAWVLKDANVAVLDVGFRAPAPLAGGRDLYQLRELGAEARNILLGDRFESLQNVTGPYLSPKLKAPAMRFVTREWRSLSPLRSPGFVGIMSFAQGGLANAWGAGVYRFTKREIERFPFDLGELEPYYERLTSLIGISGCEDDLRPYFGSGAGLQPPLDLDDQGRLLLRRYERRRRALNRQGIFIGRPRLAVLTEDKPGRPRYDYRGLEFFAPDVPAVYHPGMTLRQLIEADRLHYLPGRIAVEYEDLGDRVEVKARVLATGAVETVSCRRLILAAGALNSAKLALASRHDHTTRLPLLDNAISFVPLLAPSRIGRAQERRFFSGVQLNIVYDGEDVERPIQGSFYGLSGVLRSDFLMDLPLTAAGNVAAAKYLTPALAVIQLFYPDSPEPSNWLKLDGSGTLEIRYTPKTRGSIERLMLRAFRRLGYFGVARLCQYPPPGSSFHYAGTLPMRQQPRGPYETAPDGRLGGSRRVYVADAATFPYLPSKNHTFTLMANAMRIAAGVKSSLPV